MARCDTVRPPLGYIALQPHAARMVEHGRAVIRQVFSEPDRSRLGLAEQSGEPPLVGDAAAERACNVPATPKQCFNGDGFGRLLSQREASRNWLFIPNGEIE